MQPVLKLDGFADVAAALFELKSSTAKSVARRVLKKSAQPIAEAANAAAPVGEGENLSGSYLVTSRLTRRQSAGARKEGREDVFMYVGTANPEGVWQEFGTGHHGAQPHFRPAWESGKGKLLNDVTTGMAVEVLKSVERARRKAARAG